MSAAADLSVLPAASLDEKGLTAHIASRFHSGMPFCTISSRTLIAVNTFSPFDMNQDQVFRDLATRITHRMQARGESQAVVFMGESGSGKSVFANALSGHILTLADNPLGSRTRAIFPIIEAFTTAKTSNSPQASKVGLCLEFQYDQSDTLIGTSISDYRLEKSRVTTIPTNERSFNVFYQLFGGLSHDERYHLQLNDRSQNFRYMGNASQQKIAGIDDRGQFKQLKSSFFTLGFSRAEVANIFQVLAAILHLGQVQFKPAASDSSVAQTMAVEIQNMDILELVASFLGVRADVLSTCLVSKTVYMDKDRVTIVLDPRGARENADEVARTLYTMLWQWILDRINGTLSLNSGEEANPNVATTINVVDFPGFRTGQSPSLDRLLHNTANELLYNFALHVYFQKNQDVLSSDDIELDPSEDHYDNSDTVKTLVRPRLGLLSVIDDYTRRNRDQFQLIESLAKRFDNSGTIRVNKPKFQFTVRHFEGEVDYSTQGLLEDSREDISGDILQLFTASTSSDFMKQLFEKSAVVDDTFGDDQRVIAAHISTAPKRQPSLMHSNSLIRRTGSTRRKHTEGRGAQEKRGDERGGERDQEHKKSHGTPQGAAKFVSSVDRLIDVLDETNAYFCICLKPNDHKLMQQFDARCVRQQVIGYGLQDLAKRTKITDHSIFMPFGEYLRYSGSGDAMPGDTERDHAIRTIEQQGWSSRDVVWGTTGVFVSEKAWQQLVDPQMTFADAAAKKFASGGDGEWEFDAKSVGQFNMFKGDNKEFIHLNETEPDVDMTAPVSESRQRRRWLAVVWAYTWYIPEKLIRMNLASVRMAWREKLTINLIIWGMCVGCMLFLIGFPYLICPPQNVISVGELSAYSQDAEPTKVRTAIRGIVYDITKFAQTHYPIVVPTDDILGYGGKDSSDLFPMQLSAVCGGPNGSLSEFVVYGDPSNYTDSNAQYHDFRSYQNDSRPDWYLEKIEFFNKNYLKSYIGYTPENVRNMSSVHRNVAASINGFVYDVTDYVRGNVYTRAPAGYVPPADIDTNFMSQSVIDLFTNYNGEDITSRYNALSLSATERFNMDRCLKNVFMIGKLDTRGSTRCLFARYFLLAVTCFVVLIVVIKFLAALQFGSFEYPDDLKKFVICQVPAYTEDEQSLRRAIESLARTNYSDIHKLLVVICDGMIIGSGNEKATPHIVLDILGEPMNQDPPAFSYEALGEGDKQHNMAKIYYGVYEVSGKSMPYIVIVKVGKPTETFRPGNRGKRDSQMILMRFLNRVHYNLPMSPFELELYQAIQDVVGASPQSYEYIMQVDADTEVSRESLGQMVGKMVEDNKIQALCGETSLSNARHSMITMIQVYEYYISHNLAKAFESLFGSVTCLPGCFTLYRIFDQHNKPIFVATPIIQGYSENVVRTLHTKNLLHLGEDRYLTTLLLKYNGQYRTKYLRHAHAYTIAPDSWSVFLSQRRRWINSTVHNFVELMPSSGMCGFCCFSMRFIVILDLFSTLIQPVTCFYLAYLIYLCIANPDNVPITSIAMIAAIYGLQAVVFVLRRKWEMIGWMVVYIFALPIFSLALPLYSFWYMDDFSWGNTRMVLGEKGERLVVADEGHFDPAEIPLKRWTDYRNEMFENDEFYDNASTIPAGSINPRDSSYRAMSLMTATPEMPSTPAAGPAGGPAVDPSQPTDSEITEAVREILATADHSKLTKRQIRMQLENDFKCSLIRRKGYISSVTDALLQGEL